MVKKEKFSFLLTIFKSESDVNCDSWKHAWVYLVLSTGSKVRIKIEAKDIPPNKKRRQIPRNFSLGLQTIKVNIGEITIRDEKQKQNESCQSQVT